MEDGFSAWDDDFDAEIDWSYSRMTLTFEHEEKEKISKKGSVKLPGRRKALLNVCCEQKIQNCFQSFQVIKTIVLEQLNVFHGKPRSSCHGIVAFLVCDFNKKTPVDWCWFDVRGGDVTPAHRCTRILRLMIS